MGLMVVSIISSRKPSSPDGKPYFRCVWSTTWPSTVMLLGSGMPHLWERGAHQSGLPQQPNGCADSVRTVPSTELSRTSQMTHWSTHCIQSQDQIPAMADLNSVEDHNLRLAQLPHTRNWNVFQPQKLKQQKYILT